MNKSAFSLACLLLALACSSITVVSHAHHGIEEDIDKNSFSDLEGTIERVEWINPHVIIHVNVETATGLRQLWLVQGDTPNSLLRRGINRQSLENMSTVQLRAYPSLSGICGTTCMSYGYELTDKSGRVHVLHHELHTIVNQLTLDM